MEITLEFQNCPVEFLTVLRPNALTQSSCFALLWLCKAAVNLAQPSSCTAGLHHWLFQGTRPLILKQIKNYLLDNSFLKCYISQNNMYKLIYWTQLSSIQEKIWFSYRMYKNFLFTKKQTAGQFHVSIITEILQSPKSLFWLDLHSAKTRFWMQWHCINLHNEKAYRQISIC